MFDFWVIIKCAGDILNAFYIIIILVSRNEVDFVA